MTRYQVDSEAVHNATGSVRNTISRVQAEVSSLISQLTQLEASWQGAASTAFSAAVSEWRGTQQLVEGNLSALSQALGQAGQQYDEIESQNTRLFVR